MTAVMMCAAFDAVVVSQLTVYGDAVTSAPRFVPSSLHRKVRPGSLENVNTAVDEFVRPLGPLSAITGGVVSIVHVKVAGVGSALVAPSIARTLKVWLPSARVL